MQTGRFSFLARESEELRQEGFTYKTTYQYTVFWDGERLDCRKNQRLLTRDPRNPDPNAPLAWRFQTLMEGVRTFWHAEAEGSVGDTSVAMTAKDRLMQCRGSLGDVGQGIEGYCPLDYGKAVWEILGERDSRIQVRPKREVVNDHPTWVIDASTRHGQYTLWLDPNLGCLPRRFFNRKRSDDLMLGDKTMDELSAMPSPGGKVESRPIPKEIVYDLHSVEIEKIGERFVIVGGVAEKTTKLSNGQENHSKVTYNRTKVDLTPDFSLTPDAFTLLVPNGTKAYDIDDGSITYEWREGKLCPRIESRSER